MSILRYATATGLIVAGFLLFGQSFSSFPACDWSEQTPYNCNTDPSLNPGSIKVDQIVQLTPCHFGTSMFENGPAPFLSQQYGLPVNDNLNPDCVAYGCSGCLKYTQSCTDPDSQSPPVCVGSAPTQDVRPLAVFVYLGFVGFGFVILVGLVKPSDAVLVGILVIAIGSWWTERSIGIYASCDQSDITSGHCTAAEEGLVAVTQIINKTLNAVPNGFYTGLEPHSPFATNVAPDGDALLYGCDPLSCLVATTPCSGEEISGPTTYSCEAGQAVSFAEPVNLFFGIICVVGGIVIALLGCLCRDKYAAGEKEQLINSS